MTDIKVVPLGAGQDVGRSCIIVSLGGKNIMFDCGMHMGFNDDRRFPDFSYITKDKNLNDFLDCVIISHFHLDHCGALPYMTEMVGYDGPIYMTHPTKAICPILLEDYRKITVEKKGEVNFFTPEMIQKCMAKVRCVYVHEVARVDNELSIKMYYAGHVLGAAMILIKVGSESVLYTGDYNMTPDRHLGAAWVDRCRPNLLITESTYATTIRDSKRCRERGFLKKIHACVERGGKVLIPVFALGRAQELCTLVETYWERMNLKVPIYFTAGLAEKANQYYKLFISWTNEKIKETFVEKNMFSFKHIKTFDRSYIDQPGPMVVFATPGMLHAGTSLYIFKKWANDEKNMVIIPGYCVVGTVGHKILNGAKRLEFDKQTIEVHLTVEYLSFSAHADAKGISKLISYCAPSNVMLVHGENVKMEFLRSKITKEFRIPCYKPANGETVTIEIPPTIVAEASSSLVARKRNTDGDDLKNSFKKQRLVKAGIVMKGESIQLLDRSGALLKAGLREHDLRFTSTFVCRPDRVVTAERLGEKLASLCCEKIPEAGGAAAEAGDGSFVLGDCVTVLTKDRPDPDSRADEDVPEFDVHVTYSYEDEELGSQIFTFLQTNAKVLSFA